VNLLEVRSLSKAFGGLKAVDAVSFGVGKGMIKAVIGPNGAGKTTLFNCIAGNLRADSGEVLLGGVPIQSSASHRIAGLGVARTFQNIKLFSHMSVLENVMAGRHTAGKTGFLPAMLNLPSSRLEDRAVRDRALETLEFLGIADLADRDAVSLAFGRQRIVEFGRALALDPALLLLDEPAAGLNMAETDAIAGLIRRIRTERGVTILLIEHDMSLVMGISDEIHVLSSGRTIAEGKPDAVRRNPEVVATYLGEDDA
jgi:branched-chain amino acid transport system ATP-binding protein